MYATARQAYINILTELVKEESPTLYLEDFLYYYNKAISEYLKLRYELFEINQQLTDDLRFWKKDYSTTVLDFTLDSVGSYEYRHLLNCIVEIELTRPDRRCDHKVFTKKKYKATRMTSAIKAGVLDNIYLQPEFFRPYFDIINNRIEVYVGDIDTNSIKISTITIEYLKQPELVDLTEEQIALDDDESQVLEFSHDVGEEILKIALKFMP